jgi:hypothetical protein
MKLIAHQQQDTRQMKSFARMTCTVVALASALALSQLGFSRAGNAEARVVPPASAIPMTAADLSTLYGNKSWRWQDGAGRMEAENRRFIAIVGSGEKGSWGEGRWTVSDRGRFCFSADWHTPSGVRPNRTCFLHVIDGGTIYQRKEPGGEWYIFKHAKTQPADEFNRLVRADLVSAELKKRQQSSAPKKNRTK